MTTSTKGRKAKIEIKPGQTWKPKRGLAWARVDKLKPTEAGLRVRVTKFMPDGEPGAGDPASEHTADLAERSFRGDYEYVEG